MMCGLLGYLDVRGRSYCREQAEKALDVLNHRGPDDRGIWASDKILLGHRRLSILDLQARARHPLVNKDGSVIVTANGEIYNYVQLREELAGTHEFLTTSDSEVLVHGYSEWGIEGLLERIEGMYAFVIFDSRRQRLYLARDRAGIKPLYYYYESGALSWSSELKGLECLVGAEALEWDSSALYDFLTYLYVPAPKTLYRNAFKLEPAHYLVVDATDCSFENRRYWKLAVGGQQHGPEEASARLRELIRDGVRSQLCSDVPVGFFLSGGMDSSAVVAEASRTDARPVSTYAIGFDDADRDETRYAKQVADRFGSRHRVRILPRSAPPEMLGRLRDWYDEPFADTSAFPTFLVAKFASEEVTVVLTGDGGDEVFGGYNWYTQFARFHRAKMSRVGSLRKLVSTIRSRFRTSIAGRIANRLELGLLDDLELYARLMGGLLKDQKTRYASELEIPDDYDDYWYFRRYYREDLPVFTRLQYLDFHTYLPDDILTKVDRVTMAVSIEARVPLLSTPLIEYAFSLEESTRLLNDSLKGLFKYAYRDELPREVLSRPKQGFSIPHMTYVSRFVPKGTTKQEVILNGILGSARKAA